MNKTAIKNFAIWARNKLIADISYKAGLLGITEKGIKSPLPQSTQTVQFFDIGTKEPSSINGIEIQQRKKLVEEIERKAKESDYSTAYKNVIEEVAYTWFNRLIAIRFMEVNDYLPTRIRVLSSESNGKAEPDLVTHALEANLDYSAYEKDRIIQLKNENKLDELFRMLFIKQCNALNANLPELFEKTSDFTELLLNVSFTDKEGVVYHLVNEIAEDDFNVSKEGQVEIIGWLYQYYNSELKDETFILLKKNVKITKDRIPAATQLFTPDWIVRYMVENSLGRLWIEGHPNDELMSSWKYYLDEVEQEEDVQKQLEKIREEYKNIKPEDIKIIDPAMGSGHILVYTFDVLMQIYESHGYSQRDAAKSIVEKNLYGLDIDRRAYQLSYFAVMMKARQYNRRILDRETTCHVYAINESNELIQQHLKYFGVNLSVSMRTKAMQQLQEVIDTFIDAKEYGSILQIKHYDWSLLSDFIDDLNTGGQLSVDSLGTDKTQMELKKLIATAHVMASKYDVVITNPPYMGSSGMGDHLLNFVKSNYSNSKSDMYSVFVDRCFEFSKPNRKIALVTMHSWMFLSSFKELRGQILQNSVLETINHLGVEAFEGIIGKVVATVAFTIGNYSISNYKGSAVRLVDFYDSKRWWKEKEFFNQKNHHLYQQSDFNKIEDSPIAYWTSHNIFKIFENKNSIGTVGYPRQGLATGDNYRFLRLWYEVSYKNIGFNYKSTEEFHKSNKRYAPYNKGGSFRRWYGNRELVIKFDSQSYDILSKQGNHLPSRKFYFHEGFSWSALTTGSFSCRYNEYGFVFDTKGSSCFFDNNLMLQTMGYLNSKVASTLLKILSPTLDFNCGTIAKVPISILNDDFEDVISEIVTQNIAISKIDWDSFEISWDYQKHPFIRSVNSIAMAYDHWKNDCLTRFNTIKTNEKELNRIFIDVYGLNNELNPELESKEITIRLADLNRDIRSFISYSVGCMFGRFSLNKSGLIIAGEELDFEEFSTFQSDKDNIIPITDEEYFDDDITSMFVSFVKKAYGNESIEENLDFIAKALDIKGESSRQIIRNYFLRDFFRDHCQIYQKRPIYWLFDSGKQNGFKALIYMHRYDENTIGNLRIDYLHRMQRIYENEVGRMQDSIENSKDAREVTAATKRKEKLIKQLQETKEYDEKIAHLALARTSIDLDDGVKVNYEKVQTDRDGKKLEVLAKI